MSNEKRYYTQKELLSQFGYNVNFILRMERVREINLTGKKNKAGENLYKAGRNVRFLLKEQQRARQASEHLEAIEAASKLINDL